MPITRYLRRKMNDHAFGCDMFTPPSVIYLGILTGTPTVSGSYTEASYTGYARIAVDNNKTTFSQSSNADETEIVTNIDIYFNVHQGGSLVSVTNIGYFDAPTGGNLLQYAPYTKTLEETDRLVLLAGELKIKYVNV